MQGEAALARHEKTVLRDRRQKRLRGLVQRVAVATLEGVGVEHLEPLLG